MSERADAGKPGKKGELELTSSAVVATSLVVALLGGRRTTILRLRGTVLASRAKEREPEGQLRSSADTK